MSYAVSVETVFDERVDVALVEVCQEISLRYEMVFLEIGTDRDHVHFLVQSIPTTNPTHLVRTIKSITAREIFRRVPEVKKQLWGGEFWSKGYYISTIGRHGSEETIRPLREAPRARVQISSPATITSFSSN